MYENLNKKLEKAIGTSQPQITKVQMLNSEAGKPIMRVHYDCGSARYEVSGIFTSLLYVTPLEEIMDLIQGFILKVYNESKIRMRGFQKELFLEF